MIRTRVNAPERVFLNSSDDPRVTGGQLFSKFTCTFDTPILGAKKTMMLRATIPNAQINIPDYQLAFWYYRLDNETDVPQAADLHCVRLYPSWWIPPDAITDYVKNSYFADPSELVAALNDAAAPGGDDVTYNPFWAVSDAQFAWDAVAKKITFEGLDGTKYYTPAGYADPNVIAAINGQTITMPMYDGGGGIATTIPQPLVPYWTLNLRCGFAMSGMAPGLNSYTAGASFLNANSKNWPELGGTPLPGDSFPNLVYSQCIYLYSNIVAGVSLGSGAQHNLLAVIPVNAPQLGVVQYTALTVNMMSKMVDTIYEISIEMRDDANQPFTLPDNAQVNLELAFMYE